LYSRAVIARKRAQILICAVHSRIKLTPARKDLLIWGIEKKNPTFVLLFLKRIKELFPDICLLSWCEPLYLQLSEEEEPGPTSDTLMPFPKSFFKNRVPWWIYYRAEILSPVPCYKYILMSWSKILIDPSIPKPFPISSSMFVYFLCFRVRETFQKRFPLL
jgi:hypothetical protein